MHAPNGERDPGNEPTLGDAWDRVAAGWERWWETIEGPAHAVTERLCALTRIARGQRVLDIATGLGEPALSVARIVGPRGHVVATDLSPEMLAIARRRARALGLGNVEFVQGDLARLALPPASFDAVLCRWGVTSLPDVLATLERIRRLLVPGGAFTTAVWEAGATGRPLASLARTLADKLFDDASPAANAPEPEGSVAESLAAEMRRARFIDVETEAMTVVLAWSTPADCVQYLMDVSPDLHTRLASHSPEQQANYRQQLEARLARYVTARAGVQIPNETICAVGRR